MARLDRPGACGALRALAPLLVLAACSSSSGGGGGGGGSGSALSPFAGVWTGRVSRPTSSVPVLALVTPDGILRATFVSAEYELAADSLLLDWLHPADPLGAREGEMHWLLVRGEPWIPLAYDGFAQPADTIEARFAAGSALSTMILAPASPSKVALDDVAGAWVATQGTKAPALELEITEEGVLSGEDALDCRYDGTVREPTAGVGMVEITGTVESDAGVRDFVGCAGLFERAPDDEVLVVAIHWAVLEGQDFRVHVLERDAEPVTAPASYGRGWIYAADGARVELVGEVRARTR